MKQPRAEFRGFSLIEVLVALVIIGVGMLGIAKIQALAYASTGTASLRSLAAIEASSLASAMRANRSYWSVTAQTVLQTIQITGAAITSSTDPALTGVNNCTSGATCIPQNLAAYDLQNWVTSLNTLLPGDTATVSCIPNPTANYPVGCTITVSWAERNTGINAQSQGTAMALPSYTLYVEP
jgi:type IV pilus assembly protein PilV